MTGTPSFTCTRVPVLVLSSYSGPVWDALVYDFRFHLANLDPCDSKSNPHFLAGCYLWEPCHLARPRSCVEGWAQDRFFIKTYTQKLALVIPVPSSEPAQFLLSFTRDRVHMTVESLLDTNAGGVSGHVEIAVSFISAGVCVCVPLRGLLAHG